ncbi:hypothetical protein ACVI8K_009095 [Bradyrhizobium barranii subsp. barranii]
MRYDWTPLWRSTIGFDHLFDVLDEVQSWPRLFGQRPAGFKWIPAGLC